MTDSEPTPAELERLADRLRTAAPTPNPGFRAALGAALAKEVQRRRVKARPEHLWFIVMFLALSGLSLVALAASQI